MKDSFVKGFVGFAVGLTVVKTIKEVRQKRLEKEMLKQVEVSDDEHSEKE